MLRGRHWTCWSFELDSCGVLKIPLLHTIRTKSNLCKTHKHASTRANTQHFQSSLPLQRSVRVRVVCNSCSVCWSHTIASMCHCWGRHKLTTGQRNHYLPRSSRHLGSRHAAACGEPRQTHAHTQTHTSAHECVWQRKGEMDRHGYMKQSETGSWEKRSELP